jgi:hypothetical protein
MRKQSKLKENKFTKDFESLLQALLRAEGEDKKRVAAKILVVAGYLHNTPTARFNWVEDRPTSQV